MWSCPIILQVLWRSFLSPETELLCRELQSSSPKVVPILSDRLPPTYIRLSSALTESICMSLIWAETAYIPTVLRTAGFCFPTIPDSLLLPAKVLAISHIQRTADSFICSRNSEAMWCRLKLVLTADSARWEVLRPIPCMRQAVPTSIYLLTANSSTPATVSRVTA